MGNDARNIGLTADAGVAAAAIQERFHIPHMSDAARVGLAYAIAKDLGLADAPTGPRAHNFNVATIDNEGVLHLLFDALGIEVSEDSGVYKHAETLMNAGLIRLASDINAGRISDVSDLMTIAQVRDG